MRPIIRAFVVLLSQVLLTGCSLTANISGSQLVSPSKPLASGGLLKIIRETPDGSNPKAYATSDNILYFNASIPGNGYASYLTDATAAGTDFVTSVNSLLPSDSEFRGAIGAVRFFYSDDEGQLWRSDGTNAGTYALISTTDPFGSGSTDSMGLSASGTIGWWLKNSAGKLLQTDGTVAGTFETDVDYYAEQWGVVPSGVAIIHNNTSGSGSIDVYVFDLATRNISMVNSFAGMDAGRGYTYQDGSDKFYFPIHKWGIGNYMAVTDGTTAGTVQLETITMMDYTLEPVGKIGSNVIFLGQPTSGGGGTYRFYATQGAAAGDWNLIKDTGYSFTGPNYYTWSVDFAIQLGSQIVVRFYEYSNRSTASFCPMWVTDGTSAGTTQVGGVALKDPVTDAYYWGSNLRPFVFNNSIFFQGYDAANGVELWKFDGITSPALLADLNPGADNGIPLKSGSNRTYDASVTSTFFILPIRTSAYGTEPFVSDGTANGTQLLRDIISGSRSSLGGAHGLDFQFFTINDRTVFSAKEDSSGVEFWVTDGTASGTNILASLNAAPGDSRLTELQVLNGKIYFAGDNGSTGVEPWVSDGTESGTQLLADIDSTSSSTLSSRFVDYNGETYFLAVSDLTLADDKTSLWKTNGTTVGTVQVVNQKILDGSDLLSFSGGLFMIGWDSNGQEPWISDGTTAGTQMLTDVTSGASSTFDWGADWFATWNSKLFFAPNKGGSLTNDPWVSDGTIGGTFQMAAIDDPNDGGYPDSALGTGQWLFFWAADPTAGYELFKTDGTSGNTALVKDINPSGDSYVGNDSFYGTTNDKLIFGADDGTHGAELWVSDGTPAGTILLADINAGAASTHVRGVTQDAHFVYLLLQPDGGNWELWKTDGTSAGTVEIHEFTGGEVPGSRVDMLATDDHLFFTMCESAHGCELWRSDLSTSDTDLFWDVNIGAISTEPRSFARYNGLLYFIGGYQGGNEALWLTGMNEAPE